MENNTTIEEENVIFYYYNVSGITGSNACGDDKICSETIYVTDLGE